MKSLAPELIIERCPQCERATAWLFDHTVEPNENSKPPIPRRHVYRCKTCWVTVRYVVDRYSFFEVEWSGGQYEDFN